MRIMYIKECTSSIRPSFFATVSFFADSAPIKDLTKDGQYAIMDNIGINLNIPSIQTVTVVTT